MALKNGQFFVDTINCNWTKKFFVIIDFNLFYLFQSIDLESKLRRRAPGGVPQEVKSYLLFEKTKHIIKQCFVYFFEKKTMLIRIYLAKIKINSMVL